MAEFGMALARQLPNGLSLSLAKGPITAMRWPDVDSGKIALSFFNNTIDLRAASRATSKCSALPMSLCSLATEA